MPCQTRGSVAEARDGAEGRPVSGEEAVRSGAGRRDLLLPKHRVLHALRETELAHALRGDLDRLARLRIAAHPQTGEPIKIPAKRVCKFRLAKSVKDAVLGKK